MCLQEFLKNRFFKEGGKTPSQTAGDGKRPRKKEGKMQSTSEQQGKERGGIILRQFFFFSFSQFSKPLRQPDTRLNVDRF